MDPLRPSSNRIDSFSANNAAQNAEPPPDLAFSEPNASACFAPLAEPSQPLAVRALLDSYSRSAPAPSTGTSSAFSANSGTPTTDNNAARTAESAAPGVYADAGYTKNGDGVFLGVAALKHHDGKASVGVEVFSASAQVGAQTELQVGLARVGGSHLDENLDVSVGAEFLTARVSGGIQNEDDSHGANLGVMLTGAGVEATVAHSGWSGTLGVSASVGMAVSSGDRNIDGDETPERCFKLSIGPATAGFCTEL